MRAHTRFHIDSLDQLREQLNQLELELPIDEDLSILAEPLETGPFERCALGLGVPTLSAVRRRGSGIDLV